MWRRIGLAHRVAPVLPRQPDAGMAPHKRYWPLCHHVPACGRLHPLALCWPNPSPVPPPLTAHCHPHRPPLPPGPLCLQLGASAGARAIAPRSPSPQTAVSGTPTQPQPRPPVNDKCNPTAPGQPSDSPAPAPTMQASDNLGLPCAASRHKLGSPRLPHGRAHSPSLLLSSLRQLRSPKRRS
jgi:hypothetical protein